MNSLISRVSLMDKGLIGPGMDIKHMLLKVDKANQEVTTKCETVHKKRKTVAMNEFVTIQPPKGPMLLIAKGPRPRAIFFSIFLMN